MIGKSIKTIYLSQIEPMFKAADELAEVVESFLTKMDVYSRESEYIAVDEHREQLKAALKEYKLKQRG